MRAKIILMASAVAAAFIGVDAQAKVTAPAGARIFRLDGAGVTYAMGVNGDPLVSTDPVKTGDPVLVKAPGELSGFDPAGSVTLQEYPGQGECLVPALHGAGLT